MKSPGKTKTLLQQALGLDTEARTLLLEGINDDTIKSQVETLLLDETQLQAFLQQNNTGKEVNKGGPELLEPGTLINRIRIEQLLGQGGMGSVYLGFDEKLERQVAIKAIRPEHLKNPATQLRFIREAQILSKINHPSICQLYDYIETAQGDFLVLEYIKGQPLYQVPLTEAQKLNALADLATALSIAHEHGIVHRDLKPDNIMITDEGLLKVLDFGIAQSLAKPEVVDTDINNDDANEVANDLTQHGSLVGTIRYMSPEQANGQNIDTASDMYALGIIAQEVFCHKAAYQVMETEQLLADVQQGNRVDATGLALPLRQLIEALTQLNPRQRPTALSTVEQVNTIINAPKQRQKNIIKYSTITAGLMLLFMLLWQWQQFSQQEAIAQQITNYETRINDLVKQAEQIYVLPIHPVNQEIGSIMQQGQALFELIGKDDLLNAVEKSRLQGIVMLKGELYEDSIPLLEAGKAESQLLAYAWSNTYIEKATEYADKHGFEQTLKDQAFRKKHLEPALKYIDQAHAEAGKINPLFQAFKLSQTESLTAGLNVVNQLLEKEHWNKEAVNLKALILSAAMANAQDKGDWEQAKTYALMTADAYQLSTQMARSYPPTYSSLCLTYLRLMADGIQRSGKQISEYTQSSIEACENTLKLQPEYTYPMRLLSRIYLMKAQWETDQGISADESVTLARSWNQQANSLSDVFNNTWTQASILTVEAKQLMYQGQSGLPVIEQALVMFDQLLNVESEYQPYIVSELLYILALKAQDMLKLDQDPSLVYLQAQKLFDETTLTDDLLSSEQWALINNMAQIYWVQLVNQFQGGHDITRLGEKLIAFLSPADYLLKDDPLQLISLANTHLLMAEYRRRQQQPIEGHINLADEYITEALRINANNYNILISQATLKTLQSYFGNQDYSEANALFEQAIKLNPANPFSYQAWADGLIIQAQNNQTASQQQAAIVAANDKINQALAIDKHHPYFINTQLEIQQLAAAEKMTLNPNP